MNGKQIQNRWQELSAQHADRAYVRSKFSDEIQNRLEIVLLRIVQGLTRAREQEVLCEADAELAQEALLDIAQANETLGALAAKLGMEIVSLKDRMEMLEKRAQ